MSLEGTDDMSLEAMFSSLHDIHTAQQVTLSELNTKLEKMRVDMRVVDDKMKSELEENSLLSKELVYLSQEVSRLKTTVIEDQIKKIDQLTNEKYDELRKIEKLKNQNERLHHLKKEKTVATEVHRIKINEINSMFVDDSDFEKIDKQIKESISEIKDLQEKDEAEEASIKILHEELKEAQIEENGLKNTETELRIKLDATKTTMHQKYNDEVRMLNTKIDQLRQSQCVHRSQLRDLNKIIATQN